MRDRKAFYIIIKRSTHQEDIEILNVYTPKSTDAKYVKQKLTELKGKRDKLTYIVGDFNTFLNK